MPYNPDQETHPKQPINRAYSVWKYEKRSGWRCLLPFALAKVAHGIVATLRKSDVTDPTDIKLERAN